MLKRSLVALVIGTATLAPAAPGLAAENYVIDEAHASAHFKVNHFGWSNITGRFSDVSGTFVIDEENPANSKATVIIKAENVDTGHDARDDHLRSADFFNTKEFPEIKFVLTKVEKTGERTGKATGELTMLGVTKPVTFDFTWNKRSPHFRKKDEIHTGFSANLTLKRSDWGMSKFIPAMSDEVVVWLEIEGIKQ